jgi:hypothetical protein
MRVRAAGALQFTMDTNIAAKGYFDYLLLI